MPTFKPGLYNLAFGDKHTVSGEIDNLAITNNDDTDKVLATVVAALYVIFYLPCLSFNTSTISSSLKPFACSKIK